MLQGKYGGGTGTKASVVDASDGGVVVGEFRLDFRLGDEGFGKFGLFGDVGAIVGGCVEVVVMIMVLGGGRGHGELGEAVIVSQEEKKKKLYISVMAMSVHLRILCSSSLSF